MDSPSRDVPAAHDPALKKGDHDTPAMMNQIYRASGRNFGGDNRTIGSLAKPEIKIPLYIIFAFRATDRAKLLKPVPCIWRAK